MTITATVLVLAALSGTPGLDAPKSLGRLQPGATVTQTLDAGSRHAYRLDLATGEAVRLIVEQHGIDVALEVTSGTEAEAPSFTADGPFDRQGYESLQLLGPASWRITLVGREVGAPPGRYTLYVQAAGTNLQRQAAAAWTRATRLYPQDTAAAWRQALPHVEQAFELWQQAEETGEAARMLYVRAVLQRLLDTPREAYESARLARELARRAGKASLEGYSQNELGLDLWNLSELAAARTAFAAARQAAETLDDAFLRAAALSNGCLMNLAQGNLISGHACYLEALPRIERAQAPQIESAARTNLGRLAEHLGEPDQALAHYQRALDLLATQGDRLGQAQTLNNLGVLQRSCGELEAAMANYAEAAEIFAQLGERRWQARVLSNTGYAYKTLGELHRARVSFEHARRLFEQVEDRRGEANALDNLAQLQLDTERRRELGIEAGSDEPATSPIEHGQAVELHRQALALHLDTGDRRGEALTRRRLGDAYLQAEGPQPQNLERARVELRRAVELATEIGDRGTESQARYSLGVLDSRQGRFADARQQLQVALELAQAGGLDTYAADILLRLARVEQSAGRLDDAFTHSSAALDRLEDLRTRVEGQELRTSYSNLLRDAYGLAVELHMAAHRADPSAGHQRRALEISERGRARALLEMLQEARVEPSVELAPELQRQRTAVLRRLRAKTERLRDVRLDDASRDALSAEQLELLQRLDVLDAELRRRSPAYAEIVRPQPLSANEIQALLDPGTVLAVYHLGETVSTLWRITTDGITTFELPARDRFDTAVPRLVDGWSHLDATNRQRDFAAATELAAWLRLDALLDTSLDGSLDGSMDGSLDGSMEGQHAPQRLAVIADGSLHLLPFAALPVAGHRLIESTEVVYLPSASVLALDRRLHPASAARRPEPPASLAIFADPVFGADYPPLPASRDEAEAIVQAAPGAKTLVALGPEANRTLATGGRLRGFEVLHFATHGVIDSADPALSGLVLSASRLSAPLASTSMASTSMASASGFLSLHDIYDLHLDAELTVLSGCRTALGPVVRGEGPISLARAFMYAGSRRVVASLWPVEDRATADLMTRFYRGLFLQALPPAEALAEAQRQVSTTLRFRDPYHWAGFVLVGDWR